MKKGIWVFVLRLKEKDEEVVVLVVEKEKDEKVVVLVGQKEKERLKE